MVKIQYHGPWSDLPPSTKTPNPLRKNGLVARRLIDYGVGLLYYLVVYFCYQYVLLPNLKLHVPALSELTDGQIYAVASMAGFFGLLMIAFGFYKNHSFLILLLLGMLIGLYVSNYSIDISDTLGSQTGVKVLLGVLIFASPFVTVVAYHLWRDGKNLWIRPGK